MTFTGARRWRRKWKERKWSRRSWPLFQDNSWRGSWRGRRGRLSLSFLFFKDLSIFICWWGRHKHRSRRLKIHKEKDAIWSTETVEKRGKPSPVTEGGLVYRSQGKGWEVSLKNQEVRPYAKDGEGEVTSTDFLGNSYPFVWALPTQRQRCRFGPESGVFLSAKLPGSEEDSLLPGDVFIHTSFILGHVAMGKGLPQHSRHDTAPTFWTVLSHPGAAPSKEQVASRVARSNTVAFLEWQIGLTC